MSDNATDADAPGSHSGPTVRLPDIDRLSVESAPRWRAYIAAHSLAWQPGRTRVPAPLAGGRHLWTRDLAKHTVLALADRLRRQCGAGHLGQHRQASPAAAGVSGPMRYAVVIEEAGGNFSAYVPDLSGCVATGATAAEVMCAIGAAIRWHIESLRECREPVPVPQDGCRRGRRSRTARGRLAVRRGCPAQAVP